MQWKIGCSGFSYKDWEGIFYPSEMTQAEWLTYYARFFNTVELNVTFYRFPGKIFLSNLYKKVPDDFSFVVKAPQEITHQDLFINVQEKVDKFYEVSSGGLQEKLNAILFQLPPSYDFSEERLERIISVMNTSFNNVIEFRHRTWFTDFVKKALSENGITFCGVSYPGLPDDVVINSSTPYYRFHGIPKLYYSMYEEDFLKNVADKIAENKKVLQAFLLFNNTATRAAIENASFLQEYLDI